MEKGDVVYYPFMNSLFIVDKVFTWGGISIQADKDMGDWVILDRFVTDKGHLILISKGDFR